jgi:hypothetical protein
MTTTSNPFGDEPLRGFGLRPIYQVVYCSRASEGVDGEAVDRIIKSSHRLNPARGITGLLVFGSGIFFQWLEGPRDSVLELMDTLKTDARHRDMVTLEESEEVRERLFPDWSMELVNPTDIKAVLLDAQETARDAQSAQALSNLLEQLATGPISGLGAD